jgi:hypothetical protein
MHLEAQCATQPLRALAPTGSHPTPHPSRRPLSIPTTWPAPTPAGLPLLNRRVYATEQKMAELRDGQYDPMEAKNDARNARLKRHTS